MKFKWENRDKFISSYKPDDLERLNSVSEYAKFLKERVKNLYENNIEKILVSPQYYEILIECGKMMYSIDNTKGLSINSVPIKIDETLNTDFEICYKK